MLDPDGLGSAGLNTPVIATFSFMGYGYSNGPGYGPSYYTSGDSGNVSSATSLTLTDPTKNWTPNQWQGDTVNITGGTDAGDQETIISNTQNTLTVTTWNTTPDSTSLYVIGIYALRGASAHLAFDRSGDANNGRAYLVYTTSGGTNAADTDIFERYSTNNGATWSNPIMVNTSADSGTATSATLTTLTDTNKNWTANQWVGHSVYIVSGNDVGDSGVVASNTSNTLTLTSNWHATLDNTSQFVIGDGASQFLPTATLDQTSGALAAIWYDTQTDFQNSGNNQLAQVFGAVSADGGSTFTETQISPTRSGSLDQSNGPIAGAQMVGGGTGVTYSSNTVTDTTKDWIASPSPGWWGYGAGISNDPFWVVATWSGGSVFGYIASNTATTLNLAWDPSAGPSGSYWLLGVTTAGPTPPSNATYVITGDIPAGGGDANYIKQLGTSLGLDYYNGKFWSAWANESSDPSSPNPDYFPTTDPNHNPGDPQNTTNIYAIPITITITPGPLSGSVLGASATGGSAPALGSPSAALATKVPLPPGSPALSAGVSSAGADAVDQIFTSLLTYLPNGAAPATKVPLLPRSPAWSAGASSAGAVAVDQIFALLRSAARPSARHSAVIGSASESVLPPDPVGEPGDALTDFWFE